MIPPDDDDRTDEDPLEDEEDDDERPDHETGAGEEGDPDDEDDEDEGEDEGPEEREPGYLLTFSEQEERFPAEFPQHMEILDEMEAGDILDLDLARAGDYILWAAAQSLEEQGWTSQAIDILGRIGASGARHAALCYPEILLRLHDLLRERGDYEDALAVLERVEREDPDRRDACRERRAEVLVLTGRVDEGLRLFETAVRAIPDDPWVPLAAAWALIRAGEYDGATTWIARGERAARRLEDDDEIRAIDGEIERLQTEARIRRERRDRMARQAAAPPPPAPPAAAPHEEAAPAAPADFEAIRQAILAELDAEEVRLTRNPPRSDDDRRAAIERLGALHRRASGAWDDAVERHDEKAIAALDDLQWEVVEVAERFGLELPGVDQ